MPSIVPSAVTNKYKYSIVFINRFSYSIDKTLKHIKQQYAKYSHGQIKLLMTHFAHRWSDWLSHKHIMYFWLPSSGTKIIHTWMDIIHWILSTTVTCTEIRTSYKTFWPMTTAEQNDYSASITKKCHMINNDEQKVNQQHPKIEQWNRRGTPHEKLVSYSVNLPNRFRNIDGATSVIPISDSRVS